MNDIKTLFCINLTGVIRVFFGYSYTKSKKYIYHIVSDFTV